MNPVYLFLLSLAAILLIGTLGELIFQRTGVPDVVWLILAGIALGPVFGAVTPDQLNRAAPYFAAITLVVILFEGGRRLKLDELVATAPRAGLLGVTSFAMAAVAIAGVSQAPAFAGVFGEGWTWRHGLMLGAILGGSSSIVVMPAMARARLAPKVANLVNLESAITDAFCVVGTVALIEVIRGGAAGVAMNPMLALARSFGIGLAVGVAVGLPWILFLRLLQGSEHAYSITIAVLLLLYVLIDEMGGSAALGILTVAVLLGNAHWVSTLLRMKQPLRLDRAVRGFHHQMAFMIKSFFFVFIGAMLTASWLVAIGALLAAVLVAARVPAVYLATLGGGFDAAERRMAIVSMPRGMAAGVLATLPVAAGIAGTAVLPQIVFGTVVTSILLFALSFPFAKRSLAAVEAPSEAAAQDTPPAGGTAPAS